MVCFCPAVRTHLYCAEDTPDTVPAFRPGLAEMLETAPSAPPCVAAILDLLFDFVEENVEFAVDFNLPVLSLEQRDAWKCARPAQEQNTGTFQSILYRFVRNPGSVMNRCSIIAEEAAGMAMSADAEV